ncbi:pyocin knob domain-containing protein [Pseudomonas soli]|uniref:pyocin knob domain-containing protein n=1 Tax=Pseudomonas soli TaxID=1306993 RepID=UPI000425A8DB|nr:pyocin knob domain-containing protein [Pseudomonas soli]
MPWYRTGTVAITSGQTTVTGTGTNFSLNARVGDAFQGPDGRWYEVANIASATVLSILPAYLGTTVTAGSYGLAPMQGYVKDLADRVRQMVDGWGTALASLGTASTGTLTTSTTDSTVGRVMRIGDLGFTGTAVSLPITDLNSVTSPGRYAFGNGVTNGPATGVAYYVDVLRHGSLVTQIAYGMTAGFVGKMYTRLYSTSWSIWSEKLSVGDCGVGGYAVTVLSSAINDIRASGWYYCNNSSGANLPISSNGYLTVIAQGSLYVKQEFTQVTTGRSWYRLLLNGTWSAWVETTPFGVNQTWGLVTRVVGTTYTNDTGRTITFHFAAQASAASQFFTISVSGSGGNGVAYSPMSFAVGALISATIAIPPGATYSLSTNTGNLNTGPVAVELR